MQNSLQAAFTIGAPGIYELFPHYDAKEFATFNSKGGIFAAPEDLRPDVRNAFLFSAGLDLNPALAQLLQER